MILKFCRNIRLRQESHGSAQVLKCRIWALSKKMIFVERSVWMCADLLKFESVLTFSILDVWKSWGV